ncbi:MAG TPA: ATP-binding cassette domain-containing protein [Gaiellaceae bacterium]|jgi:ribose transport system ATP-binding protein|nr:ATP-binding cassette domain-containing protein [Gaiellaceae bacterium]
MAESSALRISVEPTDSVGDLTLSMVGITKHFDGVAALTNVSLDVEAGEVHALLGENGAGKSTLMNIASGALAPDGGTIVFNGAEIEGLTPALARELGIAMVHQHPAILPDMTVAENIGVAVGSEHLRRRDPDESKAMRAILDDVHFYGHLQDRVSSLSVARRHLLELAKAFAVSPRLLILDEPTAPLSQDSVELLFSVVRKFAAAGTAVVYITHRLGEVREIAGRVTVLRDGTLRGTSTVKAISDAELLALIVGRRLEASFPPKHDAASEAKALLQVEGLTGHGFEDISFAVNRGEIVGIGGVVGNGQPAFLRALAGRHSFSSGSVAVDGKPYSRRRLFRAAAYMPADRLTDGLMLDLNVRENAALTALDRLKTGPFVNRRREVGVVQRELSELAVRAPSLQAPVSALSGGNQQKVVMARSMLSEPSLLVADEPTQGVDVGARAEIYRILREIADRGVPVVVGSSDTKELEGLCDRIVVMSRGQAVATLDGANVTEEKIVHAAISATTHAAEAAKRERGASRVFRFVEGDYAPVIILAIVMVALGAYVLSGNSRYLSDFNINSVQFACAALGFISLGQTFALLLGGIDLSVGPLAGFLVVLGSFFVLDGKSPAYWALGFVLMFLAAAGVGLLNGALIRFAKFTPVAATLVTYIGLGGLAFTLRSAPDGYIAGSVTRGIETKVGPVPVAFIAFVVIAAGLEVALRRSKFGLRLRAVGSSEESARRVGVPVNRVALLGYVGASLMTLLGAVILLAQIGVGDPGQGSGYTLSSITAVVLGGTSLLGGRGTFIGTLLGAGLVVQVLNATVFLGLDQRWQYIFQGLLIVVGAIIYSQVRRSALRLSGRA